MYGFEPSQPRNPLPPEDVIRRLLDDTDEFAVKTVKAGQGGPFGASVNIYNSRTGEIINVGGLRANAVLSTGIATAHAEDQALTPEIVNELEAKLAKMDKRDISVIMMSSAESCPACHAKEEIVSRELTRLGLLEPERFFVVYGATYQDSKEIAGFNDEPYHSDMQKRVGQGMISVNSQKPADLPPAVAKVFADACAPTAVVCMPDGSLIVGHDDTMHDLRATAESSAIQSACRYQKASGAKTPWDLGGATLYTPTFDIGPLAYAEAQWANVTHWQVVGPLRGQFRLVTHESQYTSNHQLFMAVAAKPYNQPGSAVTVIHVAKFDNKAQHAWQDKLAATVHPEDILYNGIK